MEGHFPKLVARTRLIVDHPKRHAALGAHLQFALLEFRLEVALRHGEIVEIRLEFVVAAVVENVAFFGNTLFNQASEIFIGLRVAADANAHLFNADGVARRHVKLQNARPRFGFRLPLELEGRSVVAERTQSFAHGRTNLRAKTASHGDVREVNGRELRVNIRFEFALEPCHFQPKFGLDRLGSRRCPPHKCEAEHERNPKSDETPEDHVSEPTVNKQIQCTEAR